MERSSVGFVRSTQEEDKGKLLKGEVGKLAALEAGLKPGSGSNVDFSRTHFRNPSCPEAA